VFRDPNLKKSGKKRPEFFGGKGKGGGGGKHVCLGLGGFRKPLNPKIKEKKNRGKVHSMYLSSQAGKKETKEPHTRKLGKKKNLAT